MSRVEEQLKVQITRRTFVQLFIISSPSEANKKRTTTTKDLITSYCFRNNVLTIATLLLTR